MSDGKRVGDQAKFWLNILKDSFFFLGIVWQIATTNAEFKQAKEDIADNTADIEVLEDEKADLVVVDKATDTNFRRAGNALSATDKILETQADLRERIATLEARD